MPPWRSNFGTVFQALANIAVAAAVVLLVIVLVLVRRLHARAGQRSRLAHQTVEKQHARQAEMAARVAHLESERASPLHGLLTRRLGMIEAVAESIVRDLEQASEAPPEAQAAAAQRAVVRASQLARLAAGGRAREGQTTLPSIWPRVVALLQSRLGDTHTLRTEFPDDLPPVAGSGEEWVQILAALIENALEAMPAGGLVETGAAPAEGGTVRVWVRDTGRGIRPEILPHVMEPFYTSRAELGAEGLGLSMVASLIESLAGQVRIASRVGEGTTVELIVPAVVAPPRVADLALAGRFLVADDDSAVCGAVARMIRSYGAEAVEVATGTLARAQLTAGADAFTGAVLDVVMPGTPVGDVVAAVRARRPGFPVLLMSGYDTMRMVDSVLALGGVRFLKKPFTREELHAVLTDLAQGRTSGS
jgi:signal transduction histidine kinase/ActR/RegA family two-component response regulator